jgi:hypothetical protein
VVAKKIYCVLNESIQIRYVSIVDITLSVISFCGVIMQLIFDDLQELKDFIQEFLGESAPSSKQQAQKSVAVQERPIVTTRVSVPEPVVEGPRRGRPPKSEATALKATKAAKPPVEAIRRRDGLTLTDKIRAVIDKFVAEGKAFSANAVYDEIYKKDKDVNKQSVITSVLKQMTTNYTQVNWVEAEGNGPRKIKLYNAGKTKN